MGALADVQDDMAHVSFGESVSSLEATLEDPYNAKMP